LAASIDKLAIMWGRSRVSKAKAEEGPPPRLKDAVRQARIETAERTSVVVDLRDAEVARLELLNEALDPIFTEISAEIELFDRGITRGDTPRLWIDAIAHVAMGRDKRLYRFVQDTSYGRRVIAESFEIEKIVDAVTSYIARRLVDREHALAAGSTFPDLTLRAYRRRRRWGALKAFIFGLIVGIAALFAIAWRFAAPPS
jgi:hypothetical protein